MNEISTYLLLIADKIDAFRCGMCAGHDSHTVCEQPNIAEIIREVVWHFELKPDKKESN